MTSPLQVLPDNERGSSLQATGTRAAYLNKAKGCLFYRTFIHQVVNKHYRQSLPWNSRRIREKRYFRLAGNNAL